MDGVRLPLGYDESALKERPITAAVDEFFYTDNNNQGYDDTGFEPASPERSGESGNSGSEAQPSPHSSPHGDRGGSRRSPRKQSTDGGGSPPHAPMNRPQVLFPGEDPASTLITTEKGDSYESSPPLQLPLGVGSLPDDADTLLVLKAPPEGPAAASGISPQATTQSGVPLPPFTYIDMGSQGTLGGMTNSNVSNVSPSNLGVRPFAEPSAASWGVPLTTSINPNGYNNTNAVNKTTSNIPTIAFIGDHRTPRLGFVDTESVQALATSILGETEALGQGSMETAGVGVRSHIHG